MPRISSRRKNQIIAFLAYLATWIFFGFLYYYTANFTKGESFIFQDEVRLKMQMRAFRDQLKTDIPNVVIKDLIKFTLDDKQSNMIQMPWFTIRKAYKGGFYLLPFFCSKEEGELFSSVQENCKLRCIGDEWATFYVEIFKERGATHYAFMDVNKLEKNIWGRICREWQLSIFKGLDKDKEFCYINTGDLGKLNLVLLEEFTVFFPFSFGNPSYILETGKFSIRKISYLRSMLRYSLCYFDTTYYKLTDVLSRDDNFTLLDFLYFSAITITTLGYGDILPTDTIVRIYVMIETLLGVIIIGAFISVSFGQNK